MAVGDSFISAFLRPFSRITVEKVARDTWHTLEIGNGLLWTNDPANKRAVLAFDADLAGGTIEPVEDALLVRDDDAGARASYFTGALGDNGILYGATHVYAKIGGATKITITSAGASFPVVLIDGTSSAWNNAGLTVDGALDVGEDTEIHGVLTADADVNMFGPITVNNAQFSVVAQTTTPGATPTAVFTLPLATAKDFDFALRIMSSDGTHYFRSQWDGFGDTHGGTLTTSHGPSASDSNSFMAAPTYALSWAGGTLTLTFTGIAATSIKTAASLTILVTP